MNEIQNCDIIQDLLPGYVDHLLSPAGTEAVETHLNKCISCRRTCEAMKEEAEAPLPEDGPALDGFQRIRARTRRLKWISGGSITLILSALFSVFLHLFVVGSPAPTSLIDTLTCTYDDAADTLTLTGSAKNLDISKVCWEEDEQEAFLINVLVYERESLPFRKETHTFTLTIPNAKGYDISLACPDYDRRPVYSWRSGHYQLIDRMTEAVYEELSYLDPQRDLLSCSPGIRTAEGTQWLSFQLDHLSGDYTTLYYLNNSLVTDGELEFADYGVWVSLEEPFQVRLYDYKTDTLLAPGESLSSRSAVMQPTVS